VQEHGDIRFGEAPLGDAVHEIDELVVGGSHVETKTAVAAGVRSDRVGSCRGRRCSGRNWTEDECAGRRASGSRCSACHRRVAGIRAAARRRRVTGIRRAAGVRRPTSARRPSGARGRAAEGRRNARTRSFLPGWEDGRRASARTADIKSEGLASGVHHALYCSGFTSKGQNADATAGAPYGARAGPPTRGRGTHNTTNTTFAAGRAGARTTPNTPGSPPRTAA
jgi:hypothetical protein